MSNKREYFEGTLFLFNLTVSALQSKSPVSHEFTSKDCSAVSHLSNVQSCSRIGFFLSVNITVTSYCCPPLVFLICQSNFDVKRGIILVCNVNFCGRHDCTNPV